MIRRAWRCAAPGPSQREMGGDTCDWGSVPPGELDGLSSQYAHGIITLHLETGQRVEEGGSGHARNPAGSLASSSPCSTMSTILPTFHPRYGDDQAAIEIETLRVLEGHVAAPCAWDRYRIGVVASE